MFETFINRYILKGIIVAEKPFHIGKGRDNLDPTEADTPVIKDANGYPLIPGSSFKGVLRSTIERLLYNGNIEGFTSCFIVNKEPCISDKEVKEIKKKNKENYRVIAKEIYDKSCNVCRLFGSNNLQAKLQFKDLNCAEGTKKYYDIRDGVGIDRDTGTSRDGAKYNYEVTPAGTKFELYIIGDNLDDKDLSLFKLCINLLKSGDISIGGMTSRGLGSIRLIDEKLYKVDKSNLKEYAFNGLKEEMRCEDV